MRQQRPAPLAPSWGAISVRCGLLALPPLCALAAQLSAEQVLFCSVTSCFWGALEATILLRVKLTRACRRIPFPIRLVVAMGLDLQACWLLGSDVLPSRPLAAGSSSGGPAPASHGLTMSVVLPCANESTNAWRTVQSVFAATPSDVLHEIIVVDDASVPPISATIDPKDLLAHRARILRHDEPQGLIRTKKHGGDQATGDTIIFLDCHVKPRDGWHHGMLRRMKENPKRIVVPVITALDPETWTENEHLGAPGKKMCMNWNADFEWCNDYPGPYVPIMSGGLLGLTRYWWEMSGGYDDQMLFWGGENLDQSLRTWLCGGEIVVAEDSPIAHMWRTPSNPKTQLKYRLPTEHVRRNRLRAATAWLGEYVNKIRTMPEFQAFNPGGELESSLGSVANIQEFQEKLKCKSFDWYIDRFKDLYLPTGRFPAEVFHLRDSKSGLCISHGNDKKFALQHCGETSDEQQFHAANAKPGGACCSGIKVWDMDHCMTAFSKGQVVQSAECSDFGHMAGQHFQLEQDGLLRWQKDRGCLMPSTTAAGAAQATQAVIRPGNKCPATVRYAEDGSSPKRFRVMLEEDGHQVCLSAGGKSESPLAFYACKEGDQDQLFLVGVGGQIQLSNHLCVDAAGGGGPLTYSCYPSAAKNENQMFVAMEGSPVIWMSAGTEMCVDIERKDAISLAQCSTADKEGQVLKKEDEHADGSFKLRDPQFDLCLDFERQGDKQVFVRRPCAAVPRQRWSQPAGQLLRNEMSKLCGDANDNQTPILYPCYEAGTNLKQVFVLKPEGRVELPKGWADNGRVRIPARCFDAKPVPAVHVVVEDCKDVQASGVKWEKLWTFVPLETQIYRSHQAKSQFLGDR